ncbi:MAG: hypothetical protein NTX50_29530 [Candidatus Sumerlaeota bacterium]|nr:hypothetical protein [Candidatus Sumerlaeota bacterium]
MSLPFSAIKSLETPDLAVWQKERLEKEMALSKFNEITSETNSTLRKALLAIAEKDAMIASLQSKITALYSENYDLRASIRAANKEKNQGVEEEKKNQLSTQIEKDSNVGKPKEMNEKGPIAANSPLDKSEVEYSIFESVDQFKVSFNKAAESLHYDARILTVVTRRGLVYDGFTNMISGELAIIGALNKRSQSVNSIELFARGDGSLSSMAGRNVVIGMKTVISCVDASLTSKDRENMLQQLGVMKLNENHYHLSTSITKNGKKYEFFAWREIGLESNNFMIFAVYDANDKSQENIAKSQVQENRASASDQIGKIYSIFSSPDQFKERFNKAAKEYQWDRRIGDFEIKQTKEYDYYYCMLNVDLGISAIVNKQDQSICEIDLLSISLENKSQADLLTNLVQFITALEMCLIAVDPSASSQERVKILKGIGIMDKDASFFNQNKIIINNGRKYRFASSPIIGFTFQICDAKDKL